MIEFELIRNVLSYQINSMVKYGKGVIMTKKMTITLEDELIDAVSQMAESSGKKKTQIIREALQAYLPQSKASLEAAWREENRDAIEAYNKRVDERGLFSDAYRKF